MGSFRKARGERSPFPAVAAVGLTLGAICLGGATERIPQAATLGAMGLLFLFAPVAKWPGKGFAWPAIGLLLLASSAWWPGGWFFTPLWRAKALDAGILLPGSLSPQPAPALEGLVLLAAGLAWAGWLHAYPWESHSRRVAAQALAGGIIVLAAVALATWKMGWRIPGWLDEKGFGPFPNRNHTGAVLALGGMLSLGCAGDGLRRSWKIAIPWALGAVVVLAALAANNSRGGVLSFFGAIGLWLTLAAWKKRSWKILTVGASAVLIASAVLLLSGGPIAARFAGGADSQVAFRHLIWKDAWALIHDSPWCGAGLGNFRALFPFYRAASVVQQEVLHPESDWLWLAAELGWLAVALAASALLAWLWSALPLEKGTQRRLRAAALAAAVAAALHGLIDVPGHRLGSLLAMVVVLALARRDPSPSPEWGWARLFWRGAGLALIGAAVWWKSVPDEERAAEALSQAGRFAESEAVASQGMRREPMNWRLYFTRAGARACSGRPLEAIEDFRRARVLEPYLAGIPLEEGCFWARHAPGLAFLAWREALRRAPSPDDEGIYQAMWNAAPDDTAFRSGMLDLAKSRPGLELAWFMAAPPAEARQEMARISALSNFWNAQQNEAFRRRAAEISGISPLP